MDKLKMHTVDRAEENFKKLCELFPNAVTETKNENGEVVRAIDADVLRQEISGEVVEGSQERYQFTWPDKKKSVVLANQPIAKTLRLEREKSVGRDGTAGSIDTENIYIEGDNLDALKLLQETYLGKVKMIYIDPPYNTGNDFVYEDDFSQDKDEYITGSGQLDEQGRQLVQNPESNGRFHTDWLNMLYPRLRIARDLLSEDGVIFISIDDNEQENLKKICDEIFGSQNLVNVFIWNCSTAGGIRPKFASKTHEYIMCFAKNKDNLNMFFAPLSDDAKKMYTQSNEKGLYRDKDFIFKNKSTNPNQRYLIKCPDGELVQPKPGYIYRFVRERFDEALADGLVTFKQTETGPLLTSDGKQAHWNIYIKKYLGDAMGAPSTLIPKEMMSIYNAGTQCVQSLFDNQRVFDNVKPVDVITYLANMVTERDSIIMDFFSGSATTAHAVMQMNAEDGGNRKYIMVQLPETTDEKSEARKAGYKTICDIGEERIRRAGQKIRKRLIESGQEFRDVSKQLALGEQIAVSNAYWVESPEYKQKNQEMADKLDIGFRVFRVDSSNMQNVYYAPADFKQEQLELLADNIKPDRTPEDLLFQVMLDLGITLSSKIDETHIDGKKVFSVADGYMIACFDNDITEQTVTEIAKKQPFYAVFRDSGMASDSVMTNFEQIFETYSPKTVRRVL